MLKVDEVNVDKIDYKEYREEKNRNKIPIRHNDLVLLIDLPYMKTSNGILSHEFELEIADEKVLELFQLIDKKNIDFLSNSSVSCPPYEPIVKTNKISLKFPFPYESGKNSSYVAYKKNGDPVRPRDQLHNKFPIDVGNKAIKAGICCTGLTIENNKTYCEFKIINIRTNE
jgi:hypothetical protein